MKYKETWANFIRKKPQYVKGIIALGLYICMLTSCFGFLSINNEFLVDLRMTYSTDMFFEQISLQFQHGRNAYLLFHMIDYTFIIFFYPFLAFLSKSASHSSIFSSIGYISAIGAGISDVIENLMVDISLLVYPTQIPIMAHIAEIATIVKFSTIAVVCIILVFSLITKKIRKTPLEKKD